MADNIRATPRNEFLGLLADAMYGGLDWMKDPRRTQQMQGLAGLLESTGIPKTTERMAYGEDLTNIGRANVPLLKPETAEALMNVTPFAPAVGKAGKALGKAYLKEIDAAMMGERGGLLGAVTPQPMRLDVWHGSPHGPFRQFDPTKIGTGEGAQSYRYGHYLGEARGTGEEYKRMLSTKIDVNGQPLYKANKTVGSTGNKDIDDYLIANLGDVDAAKKNLQADIEFVKQGNPEAAKEMQNTLDQMNKLKIQKQEAGYLYKVDLPDELIAKMLNWDEPFSKQSENVQTAILKYWSDNPGLRHYGDPTKMTGEGIYGSIKAASLGPEGGARINLNPANQAAAMDLKHYGIPGIRYLDQGSRRPGVSSMTQSQIDARIDSLKADIASGLGDQKRMKDMLSSLEAERASHPELTSNFVVFPGNENLLTIKEINDQPASLLFPLP